jgi:cyanophycinase
MTRFIALAGGANARVVILPGAGTEETFPADWAGYRVFRDAGVKSITVLHTRSREEANSESFTAQLRAATAVWIPGGRQWRLADAYLGTRTVRELHALLDRGGVIGGTSAGASIQASYMVRGAVEGNTIMMSPGHEEGFGFLRDAAVDQHLTARNRQEDMLEVIARHKHLLGIGIDESTAIVVHGNRAEVIGAGRVAFYNTRDAENLRYYFLQPGDIFDLAARRTVQGRRVGPDELRDQQDVLFTMNRLFDAMRTRDTATIRAVAHPELRLFVPPTQSGAAMRISTIDQFITSIAAAPQQLDERAYDPLVRVDGPLASIWTYYEFWRGNDFSHCGTDAFNLARTGESWLIIGLNYTVQREGCKRVPRT